VHGGGFLGFQKKETALATDPNAGAIDARCGDRSPDDRARGGDDSTRAGAAGPVDALGADDSVRFHRDRRKEKSPQRRGEMKVEPEPLLASLGPHRAALSDMDGWLPFPVISDLVLQCIAATGRNDFPLVLGSSARIRHWGVMGKLLSAAADLRLALVEFVANHPRYARGAGAYLVDCGEDGLLLGYRIHYPGLRAAAPFSLGAMAFARSVLAELCGVEPTRVLLSLPRPEDISPYRRAFGRAKLVFEAEHFGVIYSRAALAKAIPTADPVSHVEIRKFVAERWNFLQPNIQDRVMRVLVPSVLEGAPSLKGTADLLVMHPRTLNRALEKLGFSFRDAVNEARFEMASQLLRDTRVGVGSLAQTLGYSEVSAFTRFFSGMAGRSPSEWKQAELAKANV
jgi:AraC-like DNA-binding protein